MTRRRYTITQDSRSPNRATLTLRSGRAIEYWAPATGGYVRVGDRQICDGLSPRGATLYLWDDQSLVGMIRREARTSAGSAIIDEMIEDDEYMAQLQRGALLA
jgi:hypothetical protein